MKRHTRHCPSTPRIRKSWKTVLRSAIWKDFNTNILKLLYALSSQSTPCWILVVHCSCLQALAGLISQWPIAHACPTTRGRLVLTNVQLHKPSAFSVRFRTSCLTSNIRILQRNKPIDFKKQRPLCKLKRNSGRTEDYRSNEMKKNFAVSPSHALPIPLQSLPWWRLAIWQHLLQLFIVHLRPRPNM